MYICGRGLQVMCLCTCVMIEACVGGVYMCGRGVQVMCLCTGEVCVHVWEVCASDVSVHMCDG